MFTLSESIAYTISKPKHTLLLKIRSKPSNCLPSRNLEPAQFQNETTHKDSISVPNLVNVYPLGIYILPNIK